MPRSKRGDGGGGDDIRREEGLQAVLLADSFTQTFRPITYEVPKVLLPLVNAPMLEYTLELLANSGVVEVIVFCCSKARMVADYLQKSKWTVVATNPDDEDDDGSGASAGGASGGNGPIVRIVSSEVVSNAGDALREVDSMSLIRSDPFVLISGDVISNMNLGAVISAHKARRKADKNCIMTMVMKRAAINHRTRELSDDLVIAVDADNGQLLRYENKIQSESVTITKSVMKEHRRMRFHYDVLDCHIDVCSPEVLVHFSDNIDYQDIRSDYVHNEVQNLELGYRFFAHVITNEYAARVHCPRTYDSVSKDIVRRWTYPMVPDTNIVGSTSFSRARGGLFKEPKVSVARSAKIGEDCVIGRGSKVGADSSVTNSVIGRNCRIGKGCNLAGCYLWDNVVIEDGSTVKQCIIASGATVRAGGTVSRGCLVSFNVILGQGVTLPEFSCLTCCDPAVAAAESDDGDDWASDASSEDETPQVVAPTLGWEAAAVGVDGKGRFYPFSTPIPGGDEDDSADSASDDGSSAGGGAGGGAGATATGAAAGAVQLDSAPSRQLAVAVHAVGRALAGGANRAVPVVQTVIDSVGGALGAKEVAAARSLLWDDIERLDDIQNADGGDAEENPEEMFRQTVADMVREGAKDPDSIETIGLEVSCFKHAEHRSFADVVHAVVPALMEFVTPSTSVMALANSIIDTIKTWAPLIAKFVQGSQDEMALVAAMQEFFIGAEFEQRANGFGFALRQCNAMELISDETVQDWASTAATSGDAGVKMLFDAEWTQKLLEALHDSSSSEDDDSDDSDDSDESDDDDDDGSGESDDGASGDET